MGPVFVYDEEPDDRERVRLVAERLGLDDACVTAVGDLQVLIELVRSLAPVRASGPCAPFGKRPSRKERWSNCRGPRDLQRRITCHVS